jgi:hypothetical protein
LNLFALTAWDRTGPDAARTWGTSPRSLAPPAECQGAGWRRAQRRCVQADTGAVRETRGFIPNSSVSAQLRSGPRLAIRPFIMIWIALLPSLVATWLFVGTLKLRGAKAR